MLSPRYYSGYDDYYSSSWAWNRETEPGENLNYIPRILHMYTAELAMTALTGAALLGFLAWSCTIRQPPSFLSKRRPLPMGGIRADLLGSIYIGVAVGQDVVKEYYQITYMLQDFFTHISQCLIFYVFYSLIHRFLDGLTDVGRPYAAVNIIHWIFLGVLFAMGMACFAIGVVNTVYLVTEVPLLNVELAAEKLYAANAILLFVASLEVVVWSVVVTVKGGRDRFRSRIAAISLIIGAFFYFALNLMWAVLCIRFDLFYEKYMPPDYLGLLESVLEFVFYVGTYVGIFLCCVKWASLVPQDSAWQAQQGSYPYQQQPYQQPFYPSTGHYPHQHGPK
ncbi:hypothetical protein N7474_007776 [Penicillium riverlandense]|uniref:uncharacterized protein n=1 Tax=Penicillium riverlandense TaxID=1903569 RepID=UPI002546C00E|nr:uncharacterized protein N7474_007776 [Penicillium riverlandense]KAJ5811475.1 hypothetical protein N7474_007776 [Penicillium riverlandense]